MRRPLVQPQPPLRGVHPSPASLQSPPKVDQVRRPKSTRKQWGTRWAGFPLWLRGSFRSSFLSLPGGIPRWREAVAFPVHCPLSPHLASDLWLWLSLSPNSLLYILILLPHRTLLTLFYLFSGCLLSGFVQSISSFSGNSALSFFGCLMLCGEWEVWHTCSAAWGFGQKAEH